MAFQAGRCSCLPSSRHKVHQDRIAPSRQARLVVRPGVHRAAAAGELALAGQVAAVEALVSSAGDKQPCSSNAAVPQQLQHLVDEQQQQQPASQLRPALDAVGASHSVVQLHSGWADLQCSSSCTEAAALQQQQPLPLLPMELDAQQQQQQQQQLQEVQQHLERLQSNSSASTSASIASSAGLLYSSSAQQQHHNSSAVDSLGSRDLGSSSNGCSQHVAAGTGMHAQQQQQRHGTQLSRWSSGGSSSSLASGLQLVRPLEGPAAAGARACTPAQLAAFCGALQLPVTNAQRLLDQHPQLLVLQPADVHTHVQQLADTLGVSAAAAAYMCSRWPLQLLLRPAQAVLQAAQRLADALQLTSSQRVVAAACHAPALLARPLPGVLQRLQGVCSWFAVAPAHALCMVAQAPELLSDSAPSIQKRAVALRGIFKLRPVCAQRLVAAYPSALFMSPRIMNNKLKVLMAIMHKDARIIGRVVVYKTPQLLRRNLEHVRICYQLLPLLLQRSEGFVFGMAAHNGRLLLAPAPKLLVRGARLQAALQLVPGWQQQWQQLRPPQAEEGFAANYSRFERLEFLVATQQAGSVALLDALLLPRAAFELQFAGWNSWWELKAQRVRQQQQQLQAQQQQQQQQQQGRQQQQQQARQRWQLHMQQAAGPQLHPGPQQQQQLQLQYQQLVHQHLRHMQHRHRQRQLQLQQHRALVLQQRALQWQQQERHQQQQQRQQQQRQQQQLELGSVVTLQPQHQQQHLQQQLPDGGGYLWGRYVQPAEQQQQQQHWQQQQEQQQHETVQSLAGAMHTQQELVVQQQQQQQQQRQVLLDNVDAQSLFPAVAAGGCNSAGSEGPAGNTSTSSSNNGSVAVQQHTHPAGVGTRDAAVLLEAATPSGIQPQQQQQHPSKGMRHDAAAADQEVFVQPRHQQHMADVSSSNGIGARYLRRKSVLQQQPSPHQHSQQLWQPAAATAGFDSM